MDPLAPLGRNDPCWCGSGRKHKRCHGNHHPASQPGAPVPSDPDDGFYISPTTVLKKDSLSSHGDGAPVLMGADGPKTQRIEYSNWDAELLQVAGDSDDSPLQPRNLGRLRVEVLRQLAALPQNESEPDDAVKEGVFSLAVESLRTLGSLVSSHPRRTLLWNEELDPAAFLGRTLLLADHVAIPDEVFGTLIHRQGNRSLREAAKRELHLAELLEAGLVIPVPTGVAMAAGGAAAVHLTKLDLEDGALVDWVRSQLILEGPTAREALLVRAADDFALNVGQFWLHAHIDGTEQTADGAFKTRLLRPFDATYDYGPWIRQVSDEAISHYVQRTNQRVVSADVYGAEYVTASLFEARLMARTGRGEQNTSVQAAVWADVPQLPQLTGPELAKLIQNEEAVEDLRRLIRASLVTARSSGDRVDALTGLAHELEASSHRLEKSVLSDRWWQGAVPGGLGLATLTIGALSGGILPLATGAVALVGSVAPALAARAKTRREAAYLFVASRRRNR